MVDSETSVIILDLAVEVIAAYISNNSVPTGDLPTLIAGVHSSLVQMSAGQKEEPVEPLKPAVSARRSVTSDYIICLEDGKRFKSLKRHLRTQYNMSPEDYREKWRLGHDYPMVAPNYAKARSQLAKEMGLGQQRRRR